jgi:hypothetical protein
MAASTPSSGTANPASRPAVRKALAQGQLPADADVDVALDLIYGPIYHRFVYHLGMPDSERLRTLIAHALRAFDAPATRVTTG